MNKREFRHDSRPYTLPQVGEYTTAETAFQHLTDQQEGAAAARLRMLQRAGLSQESGPAEDARARMLARKGLNGKICDVESARQAMIRRREHCER